MAKYDVNYSCGHFGRIQLFGKYEERERKIRWFEQYGVCPDCYREQKEAEKSIGCKEKEMSYREYKKNYSNLQTKAGSYNGETKTIIVYIPEE